MQDLKQKTLRGGVAKLCSQAANFTLRVGSLMILGRLLGPKDFGLVGMVMAFIGVLTLFKDFGLSTAAVQRADITEEQHSTLFWVNVLVGTILGSLVLSLAPVIVHLYREPRLLAVTSVLAADFVINAAGVQHGALLQRHLRFSVISAIDIISLSAGVAVGIGMALRGFGYWSLVGMTISSTVVSTISVWVATGWIPGRPHRGVGVGSMLRFGGTITLNGLIVYLAYNLEKVLLGRYWGAEALGLYGRGYQLVSIPTDNLNSAAGSVAFAALSRIRNEPERLKRYFLKGYSLVLALTLPITIVCALFAPDLIAVLLGPKWHDTAAIFRLLAPTILIFAMINPLAWLLFSLGLVGRSLKIAMVLAPLVICGCAAGLPFGPKGVAQGYSTVMALWVVPHIAWCVRGTIISVRDLVGVLIRPAASGAVAAALPLVLLFRFGNLLSPLHRLVIGGGLFVAVYLAMLLGVMKQKEVYLELLRAFKGASQRRTKVLVSA